MIQIPVTVDEVENGVDTWPEGPIAGGPSQGSTRRVLVKGSRQVAQPGTSATDAAAFQAEIYLQHGYNDDPRFDQVGQQLLITIEEVTP